MTGIERLSGGSILASRVLKGRVYCRDASQKHASLNLQFRVGFRLGSRV